MNSILLTDENGEITDPKVLEHLHQNLKLSIGDNVKITLLGNGVGSGIVSKLSTDYCKIKIEKISAKNPQWFDLVVGISRPQTTKKILEHGTTFGAASFHFYKATLSEKSYLDSKVFESTESDELIKLGLAQSATYDQLPKVSTYKYNPAEGFAHYEQKFILDLNGTETFLDQKIDFSKPIVVSVGPERGFAKEDLLHFTNAGFKSIKISKTILRVEHAIYSAVSQLEMLKMKNNN